LLLHWETHILVFLAKKPFDSIKAEQARLERSEPQFPPTNATKGISSHAKALLQDEYALKPRKVRYQNIKQAQYVMSETQKKHIYLALCH